MFGKPVIRGTRLTVEHVLRKIAAGMTDAEIIEVSQLAALDERCRVLLSYEPGTTPI